MKLFLLHRSNPKEKVTFDTFVVRARDEFNARSMCQESTGDDAWFDPDLVKCIKLVANEAEPKYILMALTARVEFP